MKKTLKVIAYLLLGLLAGLFVLYLALHKKEPQGVAGAEAEQLSQQVYTKLNKPAWDSTAWVKWTFRGDHHYRWDKRNNRLKLTHGDREVVVDLGSLQGVAKEAGVPLRGTAAAQAIKEAYAKFCNDSFWLVAPYKLTDEGTQRSVVSLPDGRKGLKVTYAGGGVTPGDSYVWIINEEGLPLAFQMWVSILPLGGVEASWEKWVDLPTGARLSTFHLIGGAYESVITGLDGGMGDAGF